MLPMPFPYSHITPSTMFISKYRSIRCFLWSWYEYCAPFSLVMAARDATKNRRILIFFSLVLGPGATAYLGYEYAPMGIFLLSGYLVILYLLWPLSMPFFAVAGFIFSAVRAYRWISGECAKYRNPFIRGPGICFNTVPYFAPLAIDLLLLILAQAMLLQVWINLERGSMLAACLIAAITGPLSLIAAKAIGTAVSKRIVAPFLA